MVLVCEDGDGMQCWCVKAVMMILYIDGTQCW